MLKAARSTRALHEAQASKEDVTVEESSPREKRKKSRQALVSAWKEEWVTCWKIASVIWSQKNFVLTLFFFLIGKRIAG